MRYQINNHSSISIKRAEREIEQHQKQICENSHKKEVIVQSTFMLGGVQLSKEQVADKKKLKTKVMGADVYEVKFKNGMMVQFMDQKDKKLQGIRFNAPGSIFANGTDIHIYNITNGYMQGTEKSENIHLDLCRNVNVDGNGGEDEYYSTQDVNFSNNSYVMHAGDKYLKSDFKGYDNLSLVDIIKKEFASSILGEYTFRDTEEHYNYIQESYRTLKQSQIVNKKRTDEVTQFTTDKAKPSRTVDEIREKVLKHHFECIKAQFENAKSIDYDDDEYTSTGISKSAEIDLPLINKLNEYNLEEFKDGSTQ